MKGLNFFRCTSCRATFNIVTYHSPHSLTWRWGLSFSFFRGDEWRVRPLWWGHSHNAGVSWGFRIPFVGIVSWQTQAPMWYRDLYMRLRDEDDQRRGLMWCSDSHPHKFRESPPVSVPASPTV